jgi:hypothetical protein
MRGVLQRTKANGFKDESIKRRHWLNNDHGLSFRLRLRKMKNATDSMPTIKSGIGQILQRSNSQMLEIFTF